MKKLPYYIVIWKDYNGVIHREEFYFSQTKALIMYMYNDITVALPHIRRRVRHEKGYDVWEKELIYPKPIRELLYLFKVKPLK